MDELKTITPEQVEVLLEAGEDLEIVDVREDEEVQQGMIEGAKHIRMGEIPNNLDYFNKDKEYILVCRSGRRSENVAYFLQERGYKVINMEGGMLGWNGEVIVK
ncbi:rhodanese-like domain-containing protein [Bacillus massiliglaciei]|uniref:rhodanese-like domain-containing protein n=1 Tax=Bacillus massiliglaciei TaxID=1816693 RepID=UPI000B0ED906|nr:rhodanese-like domain-containing protein [Bacillus massiliglaciei]